MGTVAAVVGAGASLYGAVSSANAADEANSIARRSADLQAQIAMREQDRADEQWKRYKDIFSPVEDQIVAEAMQGPRYGLAEGRASADVAQAFDKSNAIAQRTATRYGLDPSSGRFADVMAKGNNLRGLAEVDAMNRSRMAEDDKAWAKKLTSIEIGKGLPAQSAALMNSAAAGYGNTANNMYGLANQYANSASKGMQSFGNQLSKIDWGSSGGSSSGGGSTYEPWNNGDLV